MVAEFAEPSDAELVNAVREGSRSAGGSLCARHAFAAFALARHLTTSLDEAGRLVRAAFTDLLRTIRGDGCPITAVRLHLLRTLRGMRAGPLDPGPPPPRLAVAFARLPERWQAVLWHVEVEGQPPASVAPLLGLSPGGVPVLLRHARQGLRDARLAVEVADTAGEGCQDAVRALAARVRTRASTVDATARWRPAELDDHLAACAGCAALAADLELGAQLREAVVPAVLGASGRNYLAAINRQEISTQS
ncbi:RNA polymerase sigma factor [Amycolatopsis anabasis]|uniref:RNA polymerase sigma factor n=1 Tax=Amycolatopsis anabasis TaxID=1840409 RepID=UPI00131A86EA|nr:RNA polymerase subunit sigma [Amycolatopsis anabasis]